MLRALRICSCLFASFHFASTILLGAFCLQGVEGADLSVVVNPSTGFDSSVCNMSLPCQTIAYAIHSRNANLVYLSAGYFNESAVVISSSSPFVSIIGSNGGSSSSVFDCNRRSKSSGPAFSIVNTAVSISGITFQNCVNFFNGGVGGAVSASGSSVNVSDCRFFNNHAQIGGAIGVTSSSLAVSSCVFENNMAVCLKTAVCSSAWGGAIGTKESPSVSIIGSYFKRNHVQLVLSEIRTSVGGGGCISVMHKGNVSESRVTIDRNSFERCGVVLLQIGFNYQGIQFGNTYGGAVSLYYGLDAVDSLVVQNVSSAFTNNQCRSGGIISKASAGNAYGGCLSVYVGPWSVNTAGDSRVGSLTLSSMETNISGNTISNCSVQRTGDDMQLGANVYGGGISVAVGAYSYSRNSFDETSGSFVSGSTTISSTSYAISSNTLTNCSATSSLSDGVPFSLKQGANVYGGGISVAVGAYSYASYSARTLYSYVSVSSDVSHLSAVSGSTTVSSTSYAISNNTFTDCTAFSASDSYGANMHGGGISVAVGAYSWGLGSSVSGNTTVSSTRYAISSNTFTNCTTFSAKGSYGANMYGGGISVVVGAYSYGMRSSVSGSTTVSSTRYAISSNTFTNCTTFIASGSNGANVYGGGISVVVGAYSWGTSSSVSGNTTVSNTSCAISSNTLTNCIATSSSVKSYGANVYGGGIALAAGAYCYSSNDVSEVSGSTTFSNTSDTISSNTLTNCNSTSSVSDGSYGANVYGGGISVSVGAYSYSRREADTSGSFVSGSTTVSNTRYTISSNTLTNCNVQSVFALFSNGADVYGGGISVAVGAYAYSVSLTVTSNGNISGSTTVSNTICSISSDIFTNCRVFSQTSGASNSASAYGGAVSVMYGASLYVLSKSSRADKAICFSSVLRVSNCSFFECESTTSSASCASGASNAAGGAVFALVPSLAVHFIASLFTNATVKTTCGASSLSTYSLGGGMSIFQAGNVNVTSTNFTRCHAQGVLQSTNVFVSGGGLHVQASDSFSFQNGSITCCSVRSAVSTFLQSGGGALSTQNVSIVQIYDSFFRDNSDSSSSGILLLQQLKDDRGMDVTMDRSLVLIEPSSTPALNISCGANCSQSQQQRINIRFQNFNISAYSEARAKQYDSSAMMSLPLSSVLSSDRNSSLNCLFNFINNVAVLITNAGAAFLTFVCAPCARPFEIAQTSDTLELSNFQNVTSLTQTLCKTTASSDLQQCAYGLTFCSTIVNVSVGFWASFSADGKLGAATRCPRNYCGCRNILDYKNRTCQLEPPFAPRFQPDVRFNDNLCNGNRSGVLCGGCKTGFTQSLDGYSCILNDECSQNVGWTWAVSIIGYLFYSLYIVKSSLQDGDGLITCVLFYGQMSSFAQLSAISAGSQASESSSMSSWLPRVSQFESIASLSSKACYGNDISAYLFTAMKLYGPAAVLMFALALTLVLKQAQPLLQRRDMRVEVSIRATITNVILLIFSSVSTVVFKLITCSKIDDSSVVFIDGSMKCYDEKWKGLIAVVVLLCAFPFLFAAVLYFRWLPQSVHKAVCGAYSESRFYWGAVTLLFRLAMSIVFTTIRDIPSTAALIQCLLCVAILVLIVYSKPYHHSATYLFDILCHAILVVQFGLVIIGTVSDSLGFVPSESSLYFDTLNRAAEATAFLRYHPRHCSFYHYIICFLISVIFTLRFVQVCPLHRVRHAMDIPASRPHIRQHVFDLPLYQRCNLGLFPPVQILATSQKF